MCHGIWHERVRRLRRSVRLLGFRDGRSRGNRRGGRTRWRRWQAGRRHRLACFYRLMRCRTIFQAQLALDAIDSTSEVGEQLPDRFQITVEVSIVCRH